MRVGTRARSRLAAGACAAVLVLAGAQRADAQSVFFSGFTAGCFGVGCTPTTGVTTYPSTNGIRYTSSTFSGTTTNGVLDIGGTTGFGTFRIGNLGAQIPGGFDYSGTSFTLLLTFIDPVASQSTFTALVSGVVTRPIAGSSVDFDFDNNPVFFGPNNTFSVRVDDVLGVVPELTLPITGELAVQSQAVPEPITMVLLGTGLAGLGAARRRRTRVTKEDLI